MKEPFKVRRATKPENSRTNWIEKTCISCGKPFWVIPSAAKNAQTCGRVCINQRMQNVRVKINCKRCGVVKSFYRSEGREFCSSYCKQKYFSGSTNPRWVANRKANCLQCLGEFPRYRTTPSGRELVSERKFCSRDCRIQYRRENPYPTDAKVGDKVMFSDGYTHIKTEDRGWVPEHRFVAERNYHRLLTPADHVHHRNGRKSDNVPTNLQVCTASEHRKIHARAEIVGLAMIAKYTEQELQKLLE